MKTEPPQNLQPLNMIPVFVEMTDGMLDASKEQLTNFEALKGKAHVLDDDLLESVVKSLTKQTASLPNFLTQCDAWRQQALTASQAQQVDQIQSSVESLEKINQQVMFLADHYKNKTINKILEMDPTELMLGIIDGSIDSPFGPDEAYNSAQEIAVESGYTLEQILAAVNDALVSFSRAIETLLLDKNIPTRHEVLAAFFGMYVAVLMLKGYGDHDSEQHMQECYDLFDLTSQTARAQYKEQQIHTHPSKTLRGENLAALQAKEGDVVRYAIKLASRVDRIFQSVNNHFIQNEGSQMPDSQLSLFPIVDLIKLSKCQVKSLHDAVVAMEVQRPWELIIQHSIQQCAWFIAVYDDLEGNDKNEHAYSFQRSCKMVVDKGLIGLLIGDL